MSKCLTVAWLTVAYYNGPLFDKVMCRLRRLTFLAHPVRVNVLVFVIGSQIGLRYCKLFFTWSRISCQCSIWLQNANNRGLCGKRGDWTMWWGDWRRRTQLYRRAAWGDGLHCRRTSVALNVWSGLIQWIVIMRYMLTDYCTVPSSVTSWSIATQENVSNVERLRWFNLCHCYNIAWDRLGL